jgi:hypothetical protein
MPLRILHELRRRVETHRLAVQHCCEKRFRLVAFQPAACRANPGTLQMR